jgi:hypothetical protein
VTNDSISAFFAGSTALVIGGAAPPANALSPAGVVNVFDQFSGVTLESTFTESSNWTSQSFELSPHSGSQFFESDNGNFNSDFLDERFVKQLGGTIANVPYQVSFFIAANSQG